MVAKNKNQLIIGSIHNANLKAFFNATGKPTLEEPARARPLHECWRCCACWLCGCIGRDGANHIQVSVPLTSASCFPDSYRPAATALALCSRISAAGCAPSSTKPSRTVLNASTLVQASSSKVAIFPFIWIGIWAAIRKSNVDTAGNPLHPTNSATRRRNDRHRLSRPDY